MNTFLIDGKIQTGVNLEQALISLGYTNISIHPKWKGHSNGKYIARASEKPVVRCEWLEKTNSLSSASGRKSVRVMFKDPKYNYTTSVNGKLTDKEVVDYFINTTFNLGHLQDNLQTCIHAVVGISN